MKSMPRIIVTALAAVLLFTGCKQADRAQTADPTLDELPDFEAPVQISTALIGVEGRHATPARIIVPTYERIEPTAEEKVILGIKEPPLPDALVLYRPAPTPERGISSEETQLYSVNEVGGTLIGVGQAEPYYWNYGFAGRYYNAARFNRTGAAAGVAREPVGVLGPSGTMTVSEGVRSRIAARER